MKINRRYTLAPAALMIALYGYGIAQTQSAATGPLAASKPVQTTSAILQPSLDQVLQATGNVRPERWKISNALRQETTTNIDSIRRDLTNTLPPLLDAADRAPNSVAQILPAYRNINALYDVLLRVTETSRISAPNDQAAALGQALNELEGARRVLGERLQTTAVAREQHVHDLEAAARAATAAPKQVAAACPEEAATHTARHKTRRRTTTHKTAAKPATPSTSSSNGSQTGTTSH